MSDTDELKSVRAFVCMKHGEDQTKCYRVATDRYGYFHFCGRPIAHDGFHQCDDEECRKIWHSDPKQISQASPPGT